MHISRAHVVHLPCRVEWSFAGKRLNPGADSHRFWGWRSKLC